MSGENMLHLIWQIQRPAGASIWVIWPAHGWMPWMGWTQVPCLAMRRHSHAAGAIYAAARGMPRLAGWNENTDRRISVSGRGPFLAVFERSLILGFSPERLI